MTHTEPHQAWLPAPTPPHRYSQRLTSSNIPRSQICPSTSLIPRRAHPNPFSGRSRQSVKRLLPKPLCSTPPCSLGAIRPQPTPLPIMATTPTLPGPCRLHPLVRSLALALLRYLLRSPRLSSRRFSPNTQTCLPRCITICQAQTTQTNLRSPNYLPHPPFCRNRPPGTHSRYLP